MEIRPILKWFTPGDRLLIFSLLILSGLSFWFTRTTSEGAWVIVQVQGNTVARLPLNENRHFAVQGPLGETVISIQHGRAAIESSACPHQLCTQMGSVSHAGQMVVCVPNRVVVQVLGQRNSFDFITE
jgi:hypothetical protein